MVQQIKTVTDSYNRTLNYLRISITDLCNLRCRYCMPEGGVPVMEHEDILRYEEILRFVRLGAEFGFSKIRLTGGEPLVRRGVSSFINELKQIPGINDIRLTTNGLLLSKMAPDLKKAGLNSLNISLDSLDKKTYAALTGCDCFDQTWAGLMTALQVGFEKIKINCVPIKGVNDGQLLDLARLALQYPLDVRFIEFMPLGRRDFWSSEKFISSEEIRQKFIPDLGELIAVPSQGSEGPARIYEIPGAPGRLGFISAMSHNFCHRCNRLRLTADGKLKPCLISNEEIDIKSLLRDPKVSDQQIAEIFYRAATLKPLKHEHLPPPQEGQELREMSRIGG